MDNLVTDELWNSMAPFLPEHPTSAKGGRPRVPDRDCLRGILFVLREGIRWQSLPKEMACGSGSTCWRRFHQWSECGVFHKAHCHLLAVLGEQGLLNLERAVIDSASCRAQEGGKHTGPNPTDRGKKGCKRHLVTDGYGIPLVVTVGPANHRDESAMPCLLWLLYFVLGCISGRRRPGAVQADRGYGFPWTIALVLAWVASALLAPVQFTETDPRTVVRDAAGQVTSSSPIRVQNMLSAEKLTAFVSRMVKTFTEFPPLGVVLVAMPNVRQRTAMAVKTGLLRRVRAANRRSWRNASMGPLGWWSRPAEIRSTPAGRGRIQPTGPQG